MNNMKVLIIEDNDDTANIEIKIFENLGFIVDRESDGGKAIEKIKSFKPSVVILDLELPNMTGDKIQYEMYSDPELKKIPVVVNSVHISDNTDPENLGTKHFWAQYRFTGNRNPHVVKKISEGSTFTDLINEVVAAIGETYGVIPKRVADYIQKISPKNPPPFNVI